MTGSCARATAAAASWNVRSTAARSGCVDGIQSSASTTPTMYHPIARPQKFGERPVALSAQGWARASSQA